ncbi:hypothetical protein [Sedimentitalea sp. XS_ASV28]|uniref:hypothetical protein n=1 Tax=Sedimentitalea sp. XS_ASV28 TaxID=3241296 RepID=UPI0035128150
MNRMKPGLGPSFRLTGAVLIAAALSACGDDGLWLKSAGSETENTVTRTDTKGAQRDIEAPEVFDISEAGLWDGRPSLGGIWVAHPDVTDPHRVIIRNTSNDTSVVGALFRRERDIPGPRIQASSDAAEALAMLPGAPVNLHVTALLREPVAEEAEAETPQTEAQDSHATGRVDDDIVAGAVTAVEPDAPAPKERKFRWPWSRSRNDDAATDSVITPLDAPADVLETPLEPTEDSAALPDRDRNGISAPAGHRSAQLRLAQTKPSIT